MSQYPPPPIPNAQTESPYTQLHAAAGPTPFFDPVHHELNFSHQHAYPTSTEPVEQSAQPPATAGTENPQKVNRLRKACDSCSIRKVKCDEAGPPCRACAALDIPCTFERPSRRRGPPNRHAEAMKRRRVGSPGASGASSPASPTHAAQALASLSAQTSLTAESICPFDTLELLVDDFFTYIHPLSPFPHEPSFREAFARREDLSNPRFLTLLASMIAALVASFPRKPRSHLKAQGREHLFPNSMSLVQQCQRVAVAARGVGYLEREDLNVHDAIVSYFLGLTSVYTFRWRVCRLYFGETITIACAIGLFKERPSTQHGILRGQVDKHDQITEAPNDYTADYVNREIGRRLVWTLFVVVRAMQQLGASFSELRMPPPVKSDPWPPLPLEVDDQYIHSTYIEPQPEGVVSLMTGFNTNVRIYKSYMQYATAEWAYGVNEPFDYDGQLRMLDQCLRNVKHSLDGVPHELIVWPGMMETGRPNSLSYPPPPDYYSNRTSPLQNGVNIEHKPEERRRRQYEIQKANIYASYLSTRSYIVEKFWNLCEAHKRRKAQSAEQEAKGMSVNSPGVVAAGVDSRLSPPRSNPEMTEQDMYAERESIVKDLLVVLSSISQVSMEPNADNFTMKIRQIASTLLDVPRAEKGQFALKAEQYLEVFLDILMKLERTGPGHQNQDQPDDDEADLRHWANLREYQMQFAQAGGLLGVT